MVCLDSRVEQDAANVEDAAKTAVHKIIFIFIWDPRETSTQKEP